MVQLLLLEIYGLILSNLNKGMTFISVNIFINLVLTLGIYITQLIFEDNALQKLHLKPYVHSLKDVKHQFQMVQ